MFGDPHDTPGTKQYKLLEISMKCSFGAAEPIMHLRHPFGLQPFFRRLTSPRRRVRLAIAKGTLKPSRG